MNEINYRLYYYLHHFHNIENNYYKKLNYIIEYFL